MTVGGSVISGALDDVVDVASRMACDMLAALVGQEGLVHILVSRDLHQMQLRPTVVCPLRLPPFFSALLQSPESL